MAADKPVKQAPADAKSADGESEDEAPPSKLRWVVGWIIIPGLVLGGIFGAGVHLGANHPEAWYSRFVLWVVGLFG